MFQEYDVVRLRETSDTVTLPAGTKGTVLMIYPDTKNAYEVEFVDDAGNSLGTFSVSETDLIFDASS